MIDTDMPKRSEEKNFAYCKIVWQRHSYKASRTKFASA
jgi:hypothetical protein